ncbi:MAG: SMI1/KNR4 family protein [Chloroflexota bacterium]|nr:SMI1/KNR4 family protein [Chloroflexota bacterium]
MPKTNVTLAALHTAYEQWSGPPVDLIHLQKNEIDADVPMELDVLFFQPSEEDNLSEEEYFTFVATAGMSMRTVQEGQELYELICCVNGPQQPAELHLLAHRLAELAVLPFRNSTALVVPMILRGFTLPLFDKMTSLLLTDWGVGGPEWLPHRPERIRLVAVIPLYEAEADIVEVIGDVEAGQRFYHEGIRWNTPTRPAAQLLERRQAATPHLRRESMSATATRARINEIWQAIEAWYQDKAPLVHDELRGGASDAQIQQLEEKIGVTLPADYKASLQIYNGEVSVHDYTYHGISMVLSKWTTMDQLRTEGKFANAAVYEEGAGILQNTWWHSGWVPFASDGGGNMLCIDTAPAERGVVGQILQMERGSGPGITEYKSFLAWLEGYRDDLYAGKYRVDSEGSLSEA